MAQLEHQSSVVPFSKRRGGYLIGGGIVLMVGGIVGMFIVNIAIRARARSDSIGSGSMTSYYHELERLNNLAAKQGVLCVVMGLMVIIGLVLLISGIVQRVRSSPKIS
jgi:hypothetical protein